MRRIFGGKIKNIGFYLVGKNSFRIFAKSNDERTKLKHNLKSIEYEKKITKNCIVVGMYNTICAHEISSFDIFRARM